MPIETAVPIHAASLEEFHKLHTVFMNLARQVHADYGGILDDSIYKTELAQRCGVAGIQVEREVLLRVSHGTFFKDYRIDLLVERKCLVELKTVPQLTRAHHEETANYLMLADIDHGSLINFQGQSVRQRMVSTRESYAERRLFDVRTGIWPKDKLHAALQEVTLAFCGDIGLSLDTPLYRAAIANLIGGPTSIIVDIPIFSRSGDFVIGSHPMHLLDEHQGLAVTRTVQPRPLRQQLGKLIAHTSLQSIAWINLRPHLIEFEHITQPGAASSI